MVRTRDTLGLDHVPAGLSGLNADNIIYDLTDDKSASGFGHPECFSEKAINMDIITAYPISTNQPLI